MPALKSISKYLSALDARQKLRSLSTRRNLYVLSAFVVIGGVLLSYVLTQNEKPQTVTIKPDAVNKTEAKSAVSAEPATTDANATPADTNTAPAAPPSVQNTPKANTPKQIAPAAPTTPPAPQPEVIDFAFSSSTITVQVGAEATIQATSLTGRALEWAYMGGNGIFSTFGITSNGPQVTHTIGIKPSPDLATPGTYQQSVMGYIPGGQKVTKQVTVIVTAP